MPFINTRDEIGERATLDGLIDGTLTTFRDSGSYAANPANGSYFNFPASIIGTPNVSYGGYIFGGGSSEPPSQYRAKLDTVVMNSRDTLAGTFYYNDHLKILDIEYASAAKGFNTFFLDHCTSLRKIIVRYPNNVAGIGAYSVGNSSITIAGSGVEVYVYQSLILSYQTATNWSAYYANGGVIFKSIEGSDYHHHYADGSPDPHTVTYNLTYFSSSNTDTETWYGDEYETTLTMDLGHINPVVTVTVQESVCDPDTPHASGTGGGTWSTVTKDITSTAYDSETGVVSIPSITGDVTITATAT